jgi:hypothetical protein
MKIKLLSDLLRLSMQLDQNNLKKEARSVADVIHKEAILNMGIFSGLKERLAKHILDKSGLPNDPIFIMFVKEMIEEISFIDFLVILSDISHRDMQRTCDIIEEKIHPAYEDFISVLSESDYGKSKVILEKLDPKYLSGLICEKLEDKYHNDTTSEDLREESDKTFEQMNRDFSDETLEENSSEETFIVEEPIEEPLEEDEQGEVRVPLSPPIQDDSREEPKKEKIFRTVEDFNKLCESSREEIIESDLAKEKLGEIYSFIPFFKYEDELEFVVKLNCKNFKRLDEIVEESGTSKKDYTDSIKDILEYLSTDEKTLKEKIEKQLEAYLKEH